MPEIVRLEQQALRLEAEEGLFEARPFLLDHAPHEAGRENPLGHRRQDAVVRHARRAPALSGIAPSSDCSTASPPLRFAARARIFAKSAIGPPVARLCRIIRLQAIFLYFEPCRQPIQGSVGTHEQDRRRTCLALAGAQCVASLSDVEKRILQSAIDRKPVSRRHQQGLFDAARISATGSPIRSPASAAPGRSSSASSSFSSSGRSPTRAARTRRLRSLSLHLPQPDPLDDRRAAGAGHHDVAEPPGRARPHRRGARLRGQPQGGDRDHGAAREARRIAASRADRGARRRQGARRRCSTASNNGLARAIAPDDGYVPLADRQIRADRSLPRLRRGRRKCRDPRRFLRPPESVRALADLRRRFRRRVPRRHAAVPGRAPVFRAIRWSRACARKPGFAMPIGWCGAIPTCSSSPTATSTARAWSAGSLPVFPVSLLRGSC